MNEAETRAERIDPKLEPVVGCWRISLGNALQITDGKIQAGGGRSKPLIADYSWFIKASS
jgi:type I restriction enzyme R subunit